MKRDPRSDVRTQGKLVRKCSDIQFPDRSFPDRAASFLLDAFLAHRLDVLGSGWSSWERKEKKGEAEISSLHQTSSQELWGRMIRGDHRSIQWNKDPKSGFVWPADRWWKESLKLHKGRKGVDPKRPIEMGRLQHLPRVPLMVEDQNLDPEPYVEEFHDQVLDFLAAVPPGMGLHWVYAMDVGMRTMNLLLAWDLFKRIDRKGILDPSFDRTIRDHVTLHARFILDHLERQDGLTGNHYLFNITGLLFAGIYLEGSEEADKWMEWAIPELIRELFKQFHDDGVNFEGSTAYHRLSLEAFLWSSVLLSGAKERLSKMGWDRSIPLSKWSLEPPEKGMLYSTAKEPLPKAFLKRLWKGCRAMKDLTKPDGRMPQIGDNDSGRAFRFTPFGDMLRPEELFQRYEGRPKEERISGHDRLFDEDRLELFSTNALAEALFEEDPSSFGGSRAMAEYKLARGLKGGTDPFRPEREEEGGEKVAKRAFQEKMPHEKRTEIPFPQVVDLDQGVWVLRPLSGIHVFRAPDMHLTISAWTGDGLRHTLGHVHSDRSSFELQVACEDLIVDPGSYVYGADPEERNRFRSAELHSVPLVEGKEQMWWSQGGMGLFFARSDARCTILDHGLYRLSILLKYRDVSHERSFHLERDRLILLDRSDHPFHVNLNRGVPHSWGYGKKLKAEG